MKCPKCSYVSFDYNHSCPKCNKDLSSERKKCSFPSYKPNPPFLLSALIGELSDSNANMKIPEDEKALETKPGISLEDSQAVEAMKIAFQGSQDHDIRLEPEPTSPPNVTQETSIEAPLEEKTENLDFSMEDLAFEDSKPDESNITIEGDDDDLFLDLESLEFDLETEKPEESRRG